MYTKYSRPLLLLSIILFVACSGNNNKTKTNIGTVNSFDQIEYEGLTEFNPDSIKNEDIVFYNLFSPVDLTYLVKKHSSFFNSMLINPLNNITKYNVSDRIAFNLGVYGADLSYLLMFEQTQQAISYLSAIQRLADMLEIPREFVDFTYLNAETHSHNIDTLINLARDAYYQTEIYLTQTGRQQYAALILLGGWIETMCIATQMYKAADAQLVAKLAAQKFSVNSLYTLLQNNADKIENPEYLLLMKKLVKAYSAANIVFPPDSMVIDTIKKRILVKDKTMIKIDEASLTEIKQTVLQMRNHFIN